MKRVYSRQSPRHRGYPNLALLQLTNPTPPAHSLKSTWYTRSNSFYESKIKVKTEVKVQVKTEVKERQPMPFSASLSLLSRCPLAGVEGTAHRRRRGRRHSLCGNGGGGGASCAGVVPAKAVCENSASLRKSVSCSVVVAFLLRKSKTSQEAKVDRGRRNAHNVMLAAVFILLRSWL